MRSSDFNVGSVIYFISNKSEKVIPALVVEKIVRTSKDGSNVTYIVEVSQASETKSLEVDPAKTDLFSDVQSIKKFMMERTEHAIDALIAAAEKVARKYASNTSETLNPQQSSKEAPEEFTEVVLEDGKVARLRI